jgi:hypothetical protein
MLPFVTIDVTHGTMQCSISLGLMATAMQILYIRMATPWNVSSSSTVPKLIRTFVQQPARIQSATDPVIEEEGDAS